MEIMGLPSSVFQQLSERVILAMSTVSLLEVAHVVSAIGVGP